MNWLKNNYCKLILITIQVLFLGGGHVYLTEFTNLVNEMQEVKRQVMAESYKLQKTGKNIEKAGQNVNNSIKSIENELKKIKKACKRIL